MNQFCSMVFIEQLLKFKFEDSSSVKFFLSIFLSISSCICFKVAKLHSANLDFEKIFTKEVLCHQMLDNTITILITVKITSFKRVLHCS